MQQANNIKWRQQKKTLRGTQHTGATGWGFFVVFWHVFLFCLECWDHHWVIGHGHLNVSGWPANSWKNVSDGVSNTIRPSNFYHDLVQASKVAGNTSYSHVWDAISRWQGGGRCWRARSPEIRSLWTKRRDAASNSQVERYAVWHFHWWATLLRESNVWWRQSVINMEKVHCIPWMWMLVVVIYLCHPVFVTLVAFFQTRLFRRLVSCTSFHSVEEDLLLSFIGIVSSCSMADGWGQRQARCDDSGEIRKVWQLHRESLVETVVVAALKWVKYGEEIWKK